MHGGVKSVPTISSTVLWGRAMAGLNQHIRSALREIFSRYYEPRKAVMARAARYKPAYNKDGTLSKKPNKFTICSVCAGEFKDKDVQCDHHPVPVGNTPDYPGQPGEWEAWIARLFCGEEGLRAICKPCHTKVSKVQWAQLREERKRNGKKHKVGRVRRAKRAKTGAEEGPSVATGKSKGSGRKRSKLGDRRRKERTPKSRTA